MSEQELKPVSVNHGNSFGNGDWFTFHCPSCDWSIGSNTKECGSCGQKIAWNTRTTGGDGE